MSPKNGIKTGLFCAIYTTAIGKDISRQNRPRNGRIFEPTKTDGRTGQGTRGLPCWARGWPGVASKNNFFQFFLFFYLSLAFVSKLFNIFAKTKEKKKKIMTWEELEKIEAFLKENGYRNGGKPYHCNADHYWYKSFGKEDNPYEAGRSLWQVLINVYDWRKYWDRDPSLREFNKGASITVTIHVSRTINECGVEMNFDLKYDEFDLKAIEDKAYNFWQYVEFYFGAPPKE